MAQRWTITFGGCTLDEEDVTADDVMKVATLTESDGWDVLDPRSSPTHLIAWTIVAVHKATNAPIEQVGAFVNSRPMLDVMGAIQIVDRETKPKDESTETPTTDSVAVPRRPRPRTAAQRRAEQRAQLARQVAALNVED